MTPRFWAAPLFLSPFANSSPARRSARGLFSAASVAYTRSSHSDPLLTDTAAIADAITEAKASANDSAEARACLAVLHEVLDQHENA
jgi:hypothetical protein